MFKKNVIIIFLILLYDIVFNMSYANISYKNNKNENKNLFFKTNQDIKIKLQVSQADIKTFNKTVNLLNDDKWEDALSWADSIKSEHLKDAMVEYVLWKKYTNLPLNQAETEFNNLLNFIETHRYLPNLENLRLKAETMYINQNIPYQFVKEYFEKFKPVSTNTAIKLLMDKYSEEPDKNNSKLVNDIVNTFYNYDFNGEQLNYFLINFANYLNESIFIKKTEMLLWEKKDDQAKMIIKNLSTPNRILYAGIIEINKKPKYINNILRSIPKNLRENELLLFSRFLYEHKNKSYKDALKILLNMKQNSDRPDKWFLYQKFYIREMIQDKDYKKAYFLSINNNLKKGTADYAESQWMAGWIALEFLNKPKDAYYHFYNMYENTWIPVSKSRAGYWSGRAMEADSNINEAIKWYDIASKYTLYFYGQLSLHARNELLGVPSLISKNPLPEPPSFTKEEEEKILDNNVVKIAYLIAKYGDNKNDSYSLFMSAINSAKTKGERSAIFEIVKNTEKEELIGRIAKQLTYKDIYFIDNLFPLLNIINLENPNSHLVHSIIKQESGFHISAKSPVGATGFMQLMPQTAKDVARRMNLKYNARELRTNPAYNILLGSYYINSLIKQFNGSQILAIASYNAGPAAVNRWIKDYGDPREMRDIKDIVNWMELIRYSETRNYVQRIIENSIVYEYVLDKFNAQILESQKNTSKEEIEENSKDDKKEENNQIELKNDKKDNK